MFILKENVYDLLQVSSRLRAGGALSRSCARARHRKVSSLFYHFLLSTLSHRRSKSVGGIEYALHLIDIICISSSLNVFLAWRSDKDDLV